MAKEQHKQFCSLLREIGGLDVIELPPDDELPDSVFVETSAVICNGVALISKSDNPMRQKEVRPNNIYSHKIIYIILKSMFIRQIVWR